MTEVGECSSETEWPGLGRGRRSWERCIELIGIAPLPSARILSLQSDQTYMGASWRISVQPIRSGGRLLGNGDG